MGYRVNLITVPSSQDHNEKMILDDEYIRNVITGSIENNQTSIDLFFDRSFKSFQRHPVEEKSSVLGLNRRQTKLF